VNNYRATTYLLVPAANMQGLVG